MKPWRSSKELPTGEAARARILIVDDDPSTRHALCRLLRDAGVLVVDASSAKEALTLLDGTAFDLIISDVQMPRMNGIELLRVVRGFDSDISFLLISGAPDVESALEAVQLGATEYLIKPLAPDALINSARRAIATSRQRRLERIELEQARRGSSHPVSSSPMPGSWTGAVLSGRYRIGEKIGSGGMGNVYAATREDLGHMPVAVKILHEIPGREEEILSRFRREAETIARLNHPNIVRVLDFVVPPVGPPCLVMERLEGQSMAAVIQGHGPLSPGRTVFIVTQILSALTAAHDQNVVHRDLKPDNVFLTSISGLDDIVRVLDFGVAKIVGPEDSVHLTHDGALVGTPAYMSPEQARAEEVDARSDLYAVGAMMYECLSGLPPIRANNPHAMLARIQEGVSDPLGALRPELDPALVDVVDRALMKDKEQRFRTASEMAEALQKWMPPLPSSLATESPVESREEDSLLRHLRTTVRERP